MAVSGNSILAMVIVRLPLTIIFGGADDLFPVDRKRQQHVAG